MTNKTVKIGINDTPENREKLMEYVESLPAMDKSGVLFSMWEGTKETFEELLKNLVDNAPMADTLSEDYDAYDFGVAETMDKLAEVMIAFATTVHDVIQDAREDMIGNILALTLGLKADKNIPDDIDVEDVLERTNDRIYNYVRDNDDRVEQIIRDLESFTETLE